MSAVYPHLFTFCISKLKLHVFQICGTEHVCVFTAVSRWLNTGFWIPSLCWNLQFSFYHLLLLSLIRQLSVQCVPGASGKVSAELCGFRTSKKCRTQSVSHQEQCSGSFFCPVCCLCPHDFHTDTPELSLSWVAHHLLARDMPTTFHYSKDICPD